MYTYYKQEVNLEGEYVTAVILTFLKVISCATLRH